MLAKMQERFPERFGVGEEAEEPLFRRADGSDLLRSEIQGLIQAVAVEFGHAKDKFATHSLRIGGASALLHAGFSIEMIQRWGRWASSAFQAYLWESSDDARGVAEKMASDMTSLTVTRQQ